MKIIVVLFSLIGWTPKADGCSDFFLNLFLPLAAPSTHEKINVSPCCVSGDWMAKRLDTQTIRKVLSAGY